MVILQKNARKAKYSRGKDVQNMIDSAQIMNSTGNNYLILNAKTLALLKELYFKRSNETLIGTLQDEEKTTSFIFINFHILQSTSDLQ